MYTFSTKNFGEKSRTCNTDAKSSWESILTVKLAIRIVYSAQIGFPQKSVLRSACTSVVDLVISSELLYDVEKFGVLSIFIHTKRMTRVESQH